MINNSPQVATVVFYIGLTVLVIFTTISISLIFDPSANATSLMLIFVFGIVPAFAGILITYFGLYMRKKNKRRKIRMR